MKLKQDPCSTVFISGGCNATPHATDWGRNGLGVAIGNNVAIANTEQTDYFPGKYEQTLFVHTDRVNVVKWIRNSTAFENSFISASVDKTAIVWTHEENIYTPKYILEGQGDSITDVCSLSFQSNHTHCLLIATMSLDKIIIWQKFDDDERFSLLETLSFPETDLGVSGISFSLLPDTRSLILAFSKNFVDIALFTSSIITEQVPKDTSVFKYQQTLPGHTNWINDLTFTIEKKTLFLASASHDATIRIWRVFEKEKNSARLDLREYEFYVEHKHFTVVIYSILHGHDQWIYSLHWKRFEEEQEEDQKLKLLSVSADKSVIIWKRDPSEDTWVENYRLGDVGGNVSGFLGGSFGPRGITVMAHDLTGAFHVWKYDKFSDCWDANTLPSGHYDEVNDVQWDPDGRFLVSCSNDKTTRLHAPSKKNRSYWYEIARPQTHGHIISCLGVLPDFRFVSGAAEKELRSFIAPKTFIKHFQVASKFVEVEENNYPHNSAILPSLDLSNKPAEEIDVRNIEKINLVEGTGTDSEIHEVPTEDELARNTLWPEIQKLYFHPNEISCISVTRDGKLMASACKANSPKEASIVIWNTEKWEDILKIQEIGRHHLTVTQLSFSSCGLFLLSVSRDRTWNLFRKKENIFELIACTSKTNGVHKRQLNCCAWSHDTKFFATGSRDGKICVWSDDESKPNRSILTEDTEDSLNGYHCRHVLDLGQQNVCSLSFAPVLVSLTNNSSSTYLFGAGFGNGEIRLNAWHSVSYQSRLLFNMSKNAAHNGVVTRLTFRPNSDESDRQMLQFASCGTDRLVKIHEIYLPILLQDKMFEDSVS